MPKPTNPVVWTYPGNPKCRHGRRLIEACFRVGGELGSWRCKKCGATAHTTDQLRPFTAAEKRVREILRRPLWRPGMPIPKRPALE